MLRLTLTQMRRSVGRLLAAGLAIMIGTAFIAATLLGTAVIRDTTYGSITAEIADADVVVHSTDELLTTGQLAEVRALPDVAVADGRLSIFASLVAGGRQDWSQISAVSSPGLSTAELIEGELPTALGQVALSHSTAERLGLAVGDTVSVSADIPLPPPAPTSEDDDGIVYVDGDLTMVGVTQDPSALVGMGSTALVSAAQRQAWVAEAGRDLAFTDVLVRVQESATAEQVAAELSAELPEAFVQTGEEYALQSLQDITGQAYVLSAVILAFGALAMFVAAIVITNTFQVLVAQRTHTLALLRAVGATKTQIRRSVLTEALILGVVAGLAGLLLGIALAQGALWVLGAQNLPFPLPEGLSFTPWVVIVPIVTGALVTVLAALSPARAATVVSPLAALRPPQPPDPRGASRLRLAGTLALTIGGALMVAAAPFLASMDGLDEETAVMGGLALGIGGGIVSFAGVMLGMVFVVPTVVRVLGALTAKLGGGTPARIATANAVRNPRRTAATATALVIGVTLVALMSTGAVSARASLDAMLRSQFPVDVTVQSSVWDSEAEAMAGLTAAQIETVESTEGVASTAGVRQVDVSIPDASLGEVITFTVLDPDEARDVLLNPDLLDGLAAGRVVLDAGPAARWQLEDGDTVPFVTMAGDEAAPVELEVVISSERLGNMALVTPDVMEELGASFPVSELWGRLSGTEHAEIITDLQDRLTEAESALTIEDPDASGATPYVGGPAAERQIFEQVINTLLAIVIGLLAVAVVIALIGVANTLSLSVIERRRESALLRAMGLTRRQLRTMLAVEGVFLAVAGVLIGAALGLLYGWAGTAVLLGRSGDLALAVPWGYLGAIVVVALLAGLAASVLPARSAARTPPVAALAAE